MIDGKRSIGEENLARNLVAALRDEACIAITEAERPRVLDDAESVQDMVISSLGPIGGWKLGATVSAVREHLALPRAFLGALPAGRLYANAAVIEGPWRDDVGVEVEYAFRFNKHLAPYGAKLSAGQVLDAIDTVHAAIEVPASRYAGGIGSEGGFALVADNGAAGWIVVGDGIAYDPDIALDERPVRLLAGGQERARGNAAVIDLEPAELLRQFVNQATARGHAIQPGQFVLTGSCTGYVQVPCGCNIVGEISGLGTVSVEFRSGRRR